MIFCTFDMMNHSCRRFALIFEISNFCHELVKIRFLNCQKWQFLIRLSIYVFFEWNFSAFFLPLLHLTVASDFLSIIPILVATDFVHLSQSTDGLTEFDLSFLKRFESISYVADLTVHA